MNYLSVEEVSKSFGERTLFEGISFGLDQGDKMALVANNGTGKSTLFQMLAGRDNPETGSITYRKGIRKAFLDQEPTFDSTQSLSEFVQTANKEVQSLIAGYNKALEATTTDHSPAAIKALEEWTAKMDARDAWDYDRRLKEMLNRFDLSEGDQKLSELSGGQKKRLSLALALVDQPDLLILDEPTNHLDIETIEWLEDYLSKSNLTLMMVTHDRYFLDRVCNVILEMNNGKLYRHAGNYAYFLQKRAEREEVYQTDMQKVDRLLKKELEWMRRSPKARTTKSKARIDSYHQLEDKAKGRQVTKDLNLEVKMSRIGGKILELKKVYKSYGDLPILKGFDYTFRKGERIGIIGKNGVGKSTFLNIITGREAADSGKVNVGDTIVYGYYHQSGLKVKGEKRVIEVLKDVADVIQMADGSKLSASQLLEQFLFSPEMQYTYVSKLSGGEKRRLHLLTVLIKNPNFLILDEPTNDLDLITLNKLEEFLLNYPGCLIIVSHDRYFMDKLVDHLFVFEGDGHIKDFWGPYSEYKEKKEAEEKAARTLKPASSNEAYQTTSQSVKKKRFGFNEQREYKDLDKKIKKLEIEKKELTAQLSQPDLDYETLQKASERLGTVNQELDESEMRWLELDELSNS